MSKFILIVVLGISLLCISGCHSGFLREFSWFSDGNSTQDDSEPVKPGMTLVYQALEKLSFVSPLAFITMALGAIVFAYGHHYGLKILGAGFIVLAMYLGLLRYFQWVLWISFAGGACLIIYLIWIRMNAMRDTIKSVDTLLDSMTPEARKAAIAKLKDKQEDFTRSIIKKMRVKVTDLKEKV